MAGGGGNKKRFQYRTDPSGQEILYLRALQGHSGRNLIDPSLQDNVLIPNNFFEYIYHIGCAINLHSITNSGLIPGGQILSRRQTVFFTSVDPMNKEHKDPNNIDLEAPRLAWHKQKKKWKIHQDTVYWVDRKNLLNRKDLSSIKHDRSQSSFTTHSQFIVSQKFLRRNLEKLYTRHATPRLAPKISFKDNWMKELDSEVPGSSKDTEQIQPKSKTQLSSTGRLVSEQPPGLLTKEIGAVLFGCKSTNVRTERPVKSCVPVSVERLAQDKDADENVDVVICCTCGHLMVENESSKTLTNGDWMLSQSRMTSSKRCDLVVLGTAKLRHRRSTS